MPFLGKTPKQVELSSFGTRVKDNFTANGSTTTFTLSKSVANPNDIAVFVGNVRQEPTDAYTVSGTTLTMSAAPANGLNFYAIHTAGTIESSVVPAAGTTVPGAFGVSGDLSVDGQLGVGTSSHYDATTKLTVSGRINTTNGTVIGSMNYGGGSVVNVGSLSSHNIQLMTGNTTRVAIDTNGYVTKPYQPAFQAHSGASSTGAATTIIFTATDYNVGGHYNTSNGRFTAPVYGRYLFTVNALYTVSSSSATWKWIWRKNAANTGVIAEWQNNGITGSYNTIGNASIILQLAANDWVDVYNDSPSAQGNAHISGSQTRFCGILLT